MAVSIALEIAPPGVAYVNGGRQVQVNISGVDEMTRLPVTPAGGLLVSWRNPPISDSWTPLAPVVDGTGLAHVILNLEGSSGKVEFLGTAGSGPSTGAAKSFIFVTPFEA